MHGEQCCLGNLRRTGGTAGEVQSRNGNARVNCPYELAEPHAVCGDRILVRLGRRKIAMPQGWPSFGRALDFAQQKAIDTGDHLSRKVALESERLRVWERVLGQTSKKDKRRNEPQEPRCCLRGNHSEVAEPPAPGAEEALKLIIENCTLKNSGRIEIR